MRGDDKGAKCLIVEAWASAISSKHSRSEERNTFEFGFWFKSKQSAMEGMKGEELCLMF